MVFTYELLVGLAPAATDATTYPLGKALQLFVPDVPPGVYYVRLRAVSDLGPSDSNEVVITVR